MNSAHSRPAWDPLKGDAMDTVGKRLIRYIRL